MPRSIKKYVRKKASSFVNALKGKHYDVTVAESDAWSLSSENSVSSTAKLSGYSFDITVRGVGNEDFRGRSHSVDGLRKNSSKCIRRLSLDEQLHDDQDYLRRCWSEDKVGKEPKKKKFMSQFKSFLCIIPEIEHESKNSKHHREKNTGNRGKKRHYSLSEITDDVDSASTMSCQTDQDLMGTADNKVQHEAEVKVEENIDWKATGARPKTVMKDPGTSSGVSSLSPDLPEGPMLDEFMNAALKHSPRGHMASTPQISQDKGLADDGVKVETTENGTQIRQTKSMTNITATGNVLVHLSEGVQSEAPTSPSAILAVNQSTKKEDIDRLQDKTSVMLKTFESRQKVSSRRAFPKALDVLTNREDSRIVILISYNGDGKTVSGKYLLHTAAHNFKHALLIRTVKEWEMLKITEKSPPNTLVFIDNFFGMNHFSSKAFNEWEPILEEMFSACTDGNISLIIAMGKKVFDEYTAHHSRHSLFADQFIMDLSDEYKLDLTEKESMVKQNLKGFRNAKNVVFCCDEEADNTTEFCENDTLSIWNGMIKKIVSLKYPVGFPKAVEIFSSSIDNIKQGADFFLNPTFDRCQAINDIKKYRDHAWFALGNLLQSGGTLHLDTFDLEPVCINTVSKTRSRKSQTKKTLKQTLYNMLPDDADCALYLRRGIEDVRGNYVETEEEEAKFRCVSIHYSTAVCFGKLFPSDIVALMPLDFLQKFVGPARVYPDKHQLHIELDHSAYESLTKRLLREIETKNITEAMDHAYWGEKAFASFFLLYVIKEAKMKILLQTQDKITGRTVICYGMKRDYSKGHEFNNFTEQILKMHWQDHMKKKPQLKWKQEKECLKIAACERKPSTFRAIVERMASIDDECFESVIKSGSTQLLNLVFKYPTYRFDVCKALIETCFCHYSNDRTTAIYFAKLLLSKEKDLLVKCHLKKALSKAVESNNTELLEMLKSLGADLNITYRDKETLLHVACFNGNYECVKMLIDSGVETTSQTASGMTALHIAIENGHYQTATLMFRKDKNLLDMCDQSLRRPLHIAATRQDVPADLIESMIVSGADVNARDRHKKTPMHVAISAKNMEVVDILTKHNACLMLRDSDNLSPIILAYNENIFYDVETIFIRNGKFDFYDTELLFKALELREKSLVKCLLQKMNVNLKDMKGNTLLHTAIELNLYSMVLVLIQCDNIDLELDSNGVLPIHQAVLQGHFDSFRLLTEKANNLSTHNRTGNTILHVASEQGRLEFVEYILSTNYSLAGVKNVKGETPLVKAVHKGHDKVVEILTKYSASKSDEEISDLKALEIYALKKRNVANGRNDVIEAERYDRIYSSLLKAIQSV